MAKVYRHPDNPDLVRIVFDGVIASGVVEVTPTHMDWAPAGDVPDDWVELTPES